MKNINFGTIKLYIRPSCFATFGTIYGIGKVKAKQIEFVPS
jgi:hypothetical protein